MDLLEYQAKELFQQVGIPTLPSQQIAHPRDLKGLTIPYPIVLKSQVFSGGRARAGGIRFVSNTIDAIAATQAIFHLPIMGQFPDVVLAEAKYDASQELYLAIIIDRSSRRPMLLGSCQGGVDLEAIANIQQVIVDQAFSPFYARRLAIAMGLTGPLINSVSSMIEKMYRLFLQKDLDLIEINPLAVGPDGALMALDGKVTVNDNALARHENLAALKARLPNAFSGNRAVHYTDLDVVDLDGSIGIVCNGIGLTLASLDLLTQAGGKAACCIHLNGEFHHDLVANQFQERLHRGLDILSRDKRIRAILVNLCSDSMSCVQAAEAIAAYMRRRSRGKVTAPPLVVRLLGRGQSAARLPLADLDLDLVDQLDEAIAKTIQLTRPRSNLVRTSHAD